ncbi:hypothetical protein [Aquabacterium sp.]|uniref:hypothetical protein n=1 Tax=Aquabacterium sp. TaxID=1872578 RepID=UPI0035B1DF97
MKSALMVGMALFISGIVAALLQMWFTPWSAELFLKIEITLGALFLIAIAVWFTRKEYSDFRRQEKDVSLDD